MIDPRAETIQTSLIDWPAARIGRRRFLGLLASAGLSASLGSAAYETAAVAEANQRTRRKALRAGVRLPYRRSGCRRLRDRRRACRYGRRGPCCWRRAVMMRFRKSKPRALVHEYRGALGLAIYGGG